MIVLHALGQCLIRTAVTTITPRADACFALASYLTQERGKRIPRRHVERLFWPAMRASDASHSLSELIHKLRRKGVPIERDDAACIWLAREAAAVDIESFEAEPAVSMADRDLSILPGYAPRASQEFNDWVDEWRNRMQLRLLDNLLAALTQSVSAQDWTLTLALANQALTIDAESEPALRARARAADQLARYDRSPAAAQPPLLAVGAAPSLLRERGALELVPGPASRPASADMPLVGREAPMQRLRAQAACALDGKLSAAFISAPAGIGKSRLVRELSTWMRTSGAVVCSVSCGRHDAGRPLSAFVQAVPRLRSLPGAAGCAPSTLACLDRITQLGTEQRDIMTPDDAASLSASTRAAVLDLVDAVADEQPLLLVVEDVHWIDAASWALLRTIAARAGHSVFAVCTSRARWQHAVWGEPDPFRVEELKPLGPTDSRLHMLNYLQRLNRTTDDAFVDWCVETAGGNPYFIEELVNYWVATGEQYTAPPSLVALIEARLACLRPDALRVIQAAAILGKNSSLDILQQVLEFPTHVLLASVEELSDAGLLAAPSASEEERHGPVLCRHDLITHAATRGLSAHGRTMLHHAAARAIERGDNLDTSPELLWDCAYHWQAAGQKGRAVAAAVGCARHLDDMGLVHEAIASYRSALSMCADEQHRATVLRALAQSQYAARDWRAFCATVAEVRAVEHASSISGSMHDDLELCELNAQRSLHRDWAAALDMTLRCVHSLAADASHRVQAAINALKLATNIGALDTMDSVYRTVTPLLNVEGVRIQDRLTLTMIYHTIRGDTATSADTARELLQFAERTLPPRHRLSVMGDCAGVWRRSGSLDEADKAYSDVFDIAVELGCVDRAADACHRLLEMYSDSGDVDRAAAWVARYHELRRPKAELLAQPNLRLAIARVHLHRGAWHKAAALLKPPKSKLPWEDGVPMFRSTAVAMKMRLEIGRGASARCIRRWVAELEPLNASLRTTGAQDYETFSLYLGYVYAGETLTAEALLKKYVSEERRDVALPSPEIRNELARLGD